MYQLIGTDLYLRTPKRVCKAKVGGKLVTEPGEEVQMLTKLLQNKRVRQKFTSVQITKATEGLFQECKLLYYTVRREDIAKAVVMMRKVEMETKARMRTSNVEHTKVRSSCVNFMTPTKRKCQELMQSDSTKRNRTNRPPMQQGTPATPARSDVLHKVLRHQTTTAIRIKQKELAQELNELGKMHLAFCKELQLCETSDGEATAIGISSALMACPALSIETMTDTIFISEAFTNTLETLAEVCVRQHNSVRFPRIKRELYDAYAMLGTSKNQLISICRPASKRIGVLLSVPESQSNMTWEEYDEARAAQINASRARFFKETKSSQIQVVKAPCTATTALPTRRTFWGMLKCRRA